MSNLEPRRKCAWCGKPIPVTARRDSITCSKPCRQARHRFRVAPAGAATDTPLRFGFGDPPYPGLARRYYKEQPTFGGEVDHERLIRELGEGFPDGWALCTSAPALPYVLKLCPDTVRVSIWVRGSRSGVSYRARNAYEPVILHGGRPRKMTCHEVLDDVLIWGGRQHSHPGALVGMKSAPFCEWVFRQLGALAGDYLTDIFPGSGAVMRAWECFGGRNADPGLDAELRLPFADVVTAPPTVRRRTTARLDEAVARADERLDPQLALVQPSQLQQPEDDESAAEQLSLFEAS